MAIVDVGVYREGRRLEGVESIPEAHAHASLLPGAFAWVGLLRPTPDELALVAETFGLHALAVEDVATGKQRPKAEFYGDVLFLVLRPARYLDAVEEVEFGELHMFVGENFVLTIRLAENPSLGEVRRRMEDEPELLSLGPGAAAYAILDRVVDDYEPVVQGLQKDIDEIEDELFNGSGTSVALARRIYELSGEVIAFQRATAPLLGLVRDLRAREERRSAGIPLSPAPASVAAWDVELRRHLRDVEDHLIRIVEFADGFRYMLRDALSVHLGLVGREQNEQMALMTEASVRQSDQAKKISSWAAIIFAPSLVTGIYGMNFDLMPELHWAFGYPAAIGLMLAFAGSLYVIFKKKDWL